MKIEVDLGRLSTRSTLPDEWTTHCAITIPCAMRTPRIRRAGYPTLKLTSTLKSIAVGSPSSMGGSYLLLETAVSADKPRAILPRENRSGVHGKSYASSLNPMLYGRSKFSDDKTHFCLWRGSQLCFKRQVS